MTEKKINEALVEDIARILVASGQTNIIKTPDESRASLERSIEAELNAAHEAVILSAIQTAIDSCEGRTYKSKLSKSYLKNAATLLKYRMEAAHNDAITRAASAYSVDPYVDQVINNLKYNRSTVTGYRAFELAGSESALEQLLEAAIPGAKIQVTIKAACDPATVYREKCPYLGHKIWETTQVLPAVYVERV